MTPTELGNALDALQRKVDAFARTMELPNEPIGGFSPSYLVYLNWSVKELQRRRNELEFGIRVLWVETEQKRQSSYVLQEWTDSMAQKCDNIGKVLSEQKAYLDDWKGKIENRLPEGQGWGASQGASRTN